MMAQRFTGGGGRKPLDWGDEEAATRVRQDSACLSLLAGPGPLVGRVYGSDGEPMTIGRSSGCAVHLPLAEISRHHARIRYHAGRFWVEDLQTLNGTLLNQQLIDRPMPLKSGDRLRIGDQEFEVRFELHVNRVLVHDSSQVIDAHDDRTAAQSVSVRAAAAPAATASGAWIRLLTLAVLVVLPVATAMAVFVLRTVKQQRGRVVVQSVPAATAAPAAAPTNVTAPAPAAAPAATATTAAAVPVADARVELDGAVALSVSDDGTVVRALERGMPVRAGDMVIKYRRSTEDKQKELERLNAELDDDEDNARLVRRARQLAAELADEPPVTQLKSGLDGVVVDAPAPGAKLRAGSDAARLARAVRFILDPAAIDGAGTACKLRLADQSLEVTGRRVGSGIGAAIEVTRFPAELSLAHLGRVRADCR